MARKKVPNKTNDAGVNSAGASVTVELKTPKAARKSRLNDWVKDTRTSSKKMFARSHSSEG
jgi:hypothetical protein